MPTQNNPSRAASHFEKSIAVLQEIKAENELALAYAGYWRLHKQKGQIAQAREYLTKALEIFEPLATLIAPDEVREELAKLSQRRLTSRQNAPIVFPRTIEITFSPDAIHLIVFDGSQRQLIAGISRGNIDSDPT